MTAPTQTLTDLNVSDTAELISMLGEVDDVVGYVPEEIKVLIMHMLVSTEPAKAALHELRVILR